MAQLVLAHRGRPAELGHQTVPSQIRRGILKAFVFAIVININGEAHQELDITFRRMHRIFLRWIVSSLLRIGKGAPRQIGHQERHHARDDTLLINEDNSI